MIHADHLHLAINHSPLYAELFAFFLLLIGTIRRDATLTTAGLVVAILAAAAGFVAGWTGEGAAEILKHANPPIAGVDLQAIDLHAQAATFVGVSSYITAAVAIVTLWRRRRWLEIVMIVLTLWSVSVAVRTALLGGRIHHPEVRDVVRG